MSNTTQMPCPLCSYPYSKATNTNQARSELDVRRQRQCLSCKQGFVTYEITAVNYALLQSMRKFLKGLK